MGKFLIKKASSDNYTFVLKANNGEVIAVSEVYTSKNAAYNGIESICENAPIAEIEDKTLEKAAKVSLPKFEIFLDVSSEFRFRLKAKNGEIIAASEGYTAKASCANGIESVRRNALNSIIAEL